MKFVSVTAKKNILSFRVHNLRNGPIFETNDRHIDIHSFLQQTLYSLRDCHFAELPANVGTEGGYDQECAGESS